MLLNQDDIHKLSLSGNVEDRLNVPKILVGKFKSMPNKSAAWSDLIRLANDDDPDVCFASTTALESSFEYVPNKATAWQDLNKLVFHRISHIQWIAAYTLDSAFKYVPDKITAWSDLNNLAKHDNYSVRIYIAAALGSAISYIPGDLQIDDNSLNCLVQDENPCVRMYANHSLGKICIFKASKSENEETSRALLENAIQYFEIATNECMDSNPAKFCNLFYRSLDAVLFKKDSSNEKIKEYLQDAKKEARRSKSKQKLIEAIEQLAEALETAQNAKKSGISHQELLKRCSVICNRVDQLMGENKEKLPAIHELYKKNRPSFDAHIKELIDEVKKKAETVCREVRGTDVESIACSINKDIQEWHIENQEQMEKNLDNMIFSLKAKVPDIPENKSIIAKIDEIKAEPKVEDQIAILSTLIGLLPSLSLHEDISKIKENTDTLIENIDQLIDSVDKIKISLKPGIKEEIQVTVGLSSLGNGAQHVITIPLQEISYPELKEDLKKYSDKMQDIAKLPLRLKDKIAGYIREHKEKLKEKLSD
nr:hypothetical protein [uncultured Methanolobus sp.]